MIEGARLASHLGPKETFAPRALNNNGLAWSMSQMRVIDA